MKRIFDKYPVAAVIIFFGFIALILWLVSKLGKPKSAPTGTGQKMAMGGTVIGSNQSNSSTRIFGARQTASTITGNEKVGPKQKCWETDWYDSNKRHYHIEVWAINCNANYVVDAKDIITQSINAGNFNHPHLLALDINDIVNMCLAELHGAYYKEVSAGFMEFKMSGNGVWGTEQVSHIPAKPVKPSPATMSCDSFNNQIASAEKKLAYYQQLSVKQNCNVSFKTNAPPISPVVNCKQTKVINGKTYFLSGVSNKGPNGYSAIWTDNNRQTNNTIYLPISQSEYDAYRANCFKHTPIPIPDSPKMTCGQIQNAIHQIESYIIGLKSQSAKLGCNKSK